MVALPLLWLLEMLRPVRIGALLEDRIGHLAVNTDLYARSARAAATSPRAKDIFLAWNPANRQLLAMWKRHLAIVESRWLRRAYIACEPLLKRTRFQAGLPMMPNDWHELLFTTPPILGFSAAEEARGRAELANMRIGPEDWFVCFHARDPAYMGKREGFGKAVYAPSYLDSSIDNHIPAMKWIAERGGFAVRVGASVDHRLPDLGPRVIDYATRSRSDFMDIYLPAKCRFFFGTNSGLFSVALGFNRPFVLANMCPYPWVGPEERWILDIPKLLRRKSDGRILSFPEVRDMGLLECYRDDMDRLRRLFDGATYEELGLEWVENDPEDILGLTMDMMDKVEGRAPPDEAVRLQGAFRALYVRGYNGPLAGGIGPRFALRYAHLIEPHKHDSADARRLRETA